MFFVKDIITNNDICAFNNQNEEYRVLGDKFYKCNGCGSEKCIYVNRIEYPHFKHSPNEGIDCELRNSCNHYNNVFSYNLLKCISNLRAREYIFSILPSKIQDVSMPVMIRYKKLSLYIINKYEGYNNNILWILSLENRGFKSITPFIDRNDKLSYEIELIDRNELSRFDYEKSTVYLDTGFNIFIKIIKNNYKLICEIYSHIEFFNNYNTIFNRIPEREEWVYINDLNNKKIILIYNEYAKIYVKELDEVINHYKNYDEMLCNYYNELKKKQRVNYNEYIEAIIQDMNILISHYYNYDIKTRNYYNGLIRKQRNNNLEYKEAIIQDMNILISHYYNYDIKTRNYYNGLIRKQRNNNLEYKEAVLNDMNEVIILYNEYENDYNYYYMYGNDLKQNPNINIFAYKEINEKRKILYYKLKSIHQNVNVKHLEDVLFEIKRKMIDDLKMPLKPKLRCIELCIKEHKNYYDIINIIDFISSCDDKYK